MSTDRTPAFEIAVLIPCFNNTGGLIASINSIRYPHEAYIVVVVDDGSLQPVDKAEVYKRVPITVNIMITRLPRNSGIVAALNAGLDVICSQCRVRYIARLDCGDICHPDRFFKQVDFMKQHATVGLVGSWCLFKDPKTGETYEYRTPTQHNRIKKSMYFRNVFIHPTLMWRTSAMKTLRYPFDYPHAEDYGLFYVMMLSTETAIIGEFLVTCEISSTGLSNANRKAQLKSRLHVVRTLGTNKVLRFAGTLRLLTLMMIPPRIAYRMKKIAFGVKPL